jgi:hypothetical protein
MNQRLVAVLSTFLAGCSFVFAGGPPAEHQQMPYFDCPSTFGLPVADGFFATSSVLAAATTFSQGKQEYANKNDGGNRNAAGGVQVAVALAFAGSALYGIVQANRCQAAKEQLKARIMEPMLRPAPHPTPALPPPPPIPAPAPIPETPPPPAPTEPPPPQG